MMQRPFSSGSRAAPDPFDTFLERHGYYRKHTARDPSCLFRAISEQLYDTQNYHGLIRENCISFMRKHRSYFQAAIRGENLDMYLSEMAKPKTFGTFLELQAVSHIYKRNIKLFQQFDTGAWFGHSKKYTEVFRIFYTPEKHFDSVFTMEHVQNAGFCQSLVYEILYKQVFMLPDITFAVEQMLHQSSLEKVPYTDEYTPDGYCANVTFEDGRSFNFDMPENTQCILDDFRLCHFHNVDFNAFAEDYRMQVAEAAESECEPKRFQRIADSLLPSKYVSCIRQLLAEGITPFPYKVAKALNPDMYRNIEFDSWNEIRKEIRAGVTNWYTGGSNFQRYWVKIREIFTYQLQVGVKCKVQLRGSQSDLLTCHIQEISADRSSCIVFIEETGKRKLVSYDSLKPIPGDQSKGWPLPVRIQKNYERYNARMRSLRQVKFNYQKSRHQDYFSHQEFSFPKLKDIDYYDDFYETKTKDVLYKVKKFTHMQNFRTQTIEYCTMPLTIEHDRNNNGGKQPDRNNNNTKDSYSKGGNDGGFDSRQNSRAPSRSSDNPSRNEHLRDDLSDGPHMHNPFCNDHVYYENHEQIITGPPTNVPMWPSYVLPGGGMYIQSQTPIFSNTATALQHQSYNTRNEGGRSVVNIQSKVNYDARVWNDEEIGNSFPEDMTTMKFFYNLGLKYYQKTTECTGHDTKDPLVLELQSLSLSEKMKENKSIEPKKDQNNNNPQPMVAHHNPFNNPNPMQSNNHHNYNNNQRKFHSRYFNNRKDRPMTNNRNAGQGNFRHYNNNNNDYCKNKKGFNNYNNNNRDRNNQHHQQQQQQPTSSNVNTVSPSQAPVNDQSNQTSPNVTQAPEADVTPTTTFSNRTYQQQTPTVPYFVGGEGGDYSQNPGGYYIFSQPTTPQPQQFGLYLTAPVPGPPTQLSTPTPTNPNGPNGPPFSAFLGHPGPVIGAAVAPGPVQPQPYFAPGEISASYGTEPPFENISGYPPYMSYPCPFFYSPTNPSGPGNPTPHGAYQQPPQNN